MKSLSIFTLLISVSLCSTLSAQQSISGSFSSNGNTRTYIGAIPDAPQTPLRLVILLCDASEDASEMEKRGFNDYLGNNTMVVYPEPYYFMGGFQTDAVANDFLMVEDLITNIASNYTIDVNDICVGGARAGGGSFTYDLVCDFNSTKSTRAYRFKAFAVVSGEMRPNEVNLDYCPIAGEVPLIAFHGTDDYFLNYYGEPVIFQNDTIVISPTETTVDFWARTINGCDANPTVTPLPDLVVEPQVPSTVELIQYNCNNCNNTQLYRIVGGLHTWPTSDATNDNLYGGHNMDIVASQLIAEFFECTPSVVSTTDVNLDPGSVSVYPNPVVDELSIQVDGDLKMVEIYSPTGKKVLSNVAPDYTISMGHLTSGIYFLSVETDAGTIMKKIIKN